MSLDLDGDAYDQLFESAAVQDVTDADMPWLASLQGGGSDSSTSAAASSTVGAANEQPQDLGQAEPSAVEAEGEHSVQVDPEPALSQVEHETPVSLRKTDHQEAVQAAANTKGGSAGGDEAVGVNLPRSGFKVAGDQAQPIFKNVPDVLVEKMRSQLSAIVERELGVPESEAASFCDRLSQGALTTAFLMAHLDVGVDVDPATARAAVLFRRHDSLLGSVAQRVEQLQEVSVVQHEVMTRMLDQLQRAEGIQSVVEQGVSYLLADRVEHLGKGITSAVNMPMGHKSAIDARDKLRDATGKQVRLERDRAGRPIR